MSENNLNERLKKVEEQIQLINERNAKVERDKTWETSRFRTMSVSILTWLVITLLFWVIGATNPFLNAIVPTTGFYLSTQSLPILKKWWLDRNG